MRYVLMMILLSVGLAVAGTQIEYGYDAAGRMDRVTYPDGWVVDYVYDTAGNMVSRSVTRPCLDIAVLNAALPTWNDSRDIRDLIGIVNCEKPK